MKLLLTQSLEKLRSSYWFIPSLLSLGALVTFVFTSFLDHKLDPSWLDAVAWLGASQPAGARALLSTIASSMIGVAGVTFSVTIAAVSFASSTFGPRLLTNFLRDRGNQVTLGIFIATYVYCLLALRLVQDPDPTISAAEAVYFVPQITVLGALLFAVASLCVLIFFLHHVPDSIRVSTVVSNIGLDLESKVREAFPHQEDSIDEKETPEPCEEDVSRTTVSGPSGEPIRAPRSGFLQHIETDALVNTACDTDTCLRLQVRSGDFVHKSQVLGTVSKPSGSENLTDDDHRRFLTAFAFGRRRTQTQDFLFLVDELVEIAARALSPGINDPMTAMACLDWLGSGMVTAAAGRTPTSTLRDQTGTRRVISSAICFSEMAERIFDQLRSYLARDRNAGLYALDVISRIASCVQAPEQRRVLRRLGVRLGAAYAANHRLPLERHELANSLIQIRAATFGRLAPIEGRWRGVKQIS